MIWKESKYVCVGVEMVITLGHEALGRLFKEAL